MDKEKEQGKRGGKGDEKNGNILARAKKKKKI